MKRLLYIVVALVLVCALCACGEGVQDVTTEPVTTTTTKNTSLTTTTTTKVTVPYTIISDDGFTYTVNDDGNAVVIDYVGNETSVEIPMTVAGKQVVEIDFGAFKGSKVRHVKIPFGVERIGAYAFAESELESIEIPETVSFIGNNAFSFTKLVELEVPMGISVISVETFSFCEMLESVIMDSVTDIENGAFSFCPSLEAVYIPYTVEYIAQDAFAGCGYVVLYGEEDSYAQQYAEDMEIYFEAV